MQSKILRQKQMELKNNFNLYLVNEKVKKDENYYVVVITLKNFSKLNALFGITAANEIINRLIIKIKNTLKGEESVTHYLSDEIIIGLYGRFEKDITQKLKKIITIITKPISISNKVIVVDPVCGVSMLRPFGIVEEIIQEARLAKCLAKTNKYNNIFFFDESVSLEISTRQELKVDLSLAIEKNELYLLYQPIYDFYLNKIVGYEALLRWNNPKYTKIPIDYVISLAEENKNINKIGDWVFKNATKKLEELNKINPLTFISINVSPAQLVDEDFLKVVENIISKNKVIKSNIVVEVTERTSMLDIKSKNNILSKIKDLGLSVAIDDFGVDYSSLSYLSKINTDIIKIDKLFIDDIGKNELSRILYKHIVLMCKALNLSIIAEGVETKEQLEFLREVGCNQAQGYYISRPVNIDKNQFVNMKL